LNRTNLQRDIDTRLEEGEEPNVEKMCRGERKRSISSQMQKRKKKARGALHPKCRSERRKVSSLFSLQFFSSLWFFFSFLLFEKKKMPGESV
jgi:hypothetical protein